MRQQRLTSEACAGEGPQARQGVRPSAAIWRIPEALVAWGVTGDTSPCLKAVPP